MTRREHPIEKAGYSLGVYRTMHLQEHFKVLELIPDIFLEYPIRETCRPYV